MQDKGKILAQVYEFLVGREVMDGLVKISRQDETLAVQLLGIILRAKFGKIPADEASGEIDLLLAEFRLSQGSADEEE